MLTREKITELRAKGLKVEMTEHGEPYEGKREKKLEQKMVLTNQYIHPREMVM
jgi:hypothetical protein